MIRKKLYGSNFILILPYTIIEVIIRTQKVTVLLELVNRLLCSGYVWSFSNASWAVGTAWRAGKEKHVSIHPQLTTMVTCLTLALSSLKCPFFPGPNLVLVASLHCLTFSWMLTQLGTVATISSYMIYSLLLTWCFLEPLHQNHSPKRSFVFLLSFALVVCLWIKTVLLLWNQNY